MNAADIMTRPVITVAPQATITRAAELMVEHHISGLPVVDDCEIDATGRRADDAPTRIARRIASLPRFEADA